MNAIMSAFNEAWVLRLEDVVAAALIGALIGALQGYRDHKTRIARGK